MKIRILILMLISIGFTNIILAQSNTNKISVSGSILDTNNKPIQDAVIMVDNVKIDTYINSKGFYKIKIPANSKVIIAFSLRNGLKEHSYMGESVVNFTFLSNQNPVNNAKSITDNQVDVGYGNTNKEELTSSVGVVPINETNTYRNIYEMIAGKVPGVTVSGNKITIRGLSSFNSGTDPLFVVDGSVSNNINDIPPSQVSNISILKGADAAIYGARGANGVILINLNKAKKGN